MIAREHFGIDGTVSPLPGYEDSNARIETQSGDRFVLRVSPPAPDLERLRFVGEAMAEVAAASFDAPTPVLSTAGTEIAPLPDDRVARLLTWVDGTTAEDAGRPVHAATSLGQVAAEMVRVLAPMKQRVRRHDATWDPGRSVEVIDRFRPYVVDGERRGLVDGVFDEVRLVPMDELPIQVIHSDLNAGNVVVTDGTVTGVIDFEDVVSTIRIGELSVACAYAMLTQTDPISVAIDVIRGYRQLSSVTPIEATHLFTLTLARMAVSVSVAASRPLGNPHQHHISDIMWDLLTRLMDEDIRSLAMRFKEAALD